MIGPEHWEVKRIGTFGAMAVLGPKLLKPLWHYTIKHIPCGLESVAAASCGVVEDDGLAASIAEGVRCYQCEAIECGHQEPPKNA